MPVCRRSGLLRLCHCSARRSSDTGRRKEDFPPCLKPLRRVTVVVRGVRTVREGSMARISGEVVIRRTPKQVFECVADERNEPSWNPRMKRVELLTPGPVGVGTRWAATAGTPRGSTDMVIEVTGYEAPRRLDSVTQLPGMDIVGSVLFQGVAEGTRLRWRWDVRPRGALRAVGPLLGLVGRRQERQTWEGLRRHLEGDGVRR